MGATENERDARTDRVEIGFPVTQIAIHLTNCTYNLTLS